MYSFATGNFPLQVHMSPRSHTETETNVWESPHVSQKSTSTGRSLSWSLWFWHLRQRSKKPKCSYPTPGHYLCPGLSWFIGLSMFFKPGPGDCWGVPHRWKHGTFGFCGRRLATLRSLLVATAKADCWRGGSTELSLWMFWCFCSQIEIDIYK